MNKFLKVALLGTVTFFVFYLFNLMFLSAFGTLMLFGSNYGNVVTFSGIAGLAALIVVCTYLIVSKINELLKELRK